MTLRGMAEHRYLRPSLPFYDMINIQHLWKGLAAGCNSKNWHQTERICILFALLILRQFWTLFHTMWWSTPTMFIEYQMTDLIHKIQRAEHLGTHWSCSGIEDHKTIFITSSNQSSQNLLLSSSIHFVNKKELAGKQIKTEIFISKLEQFKLKVVIKKSLDVGLRTNSNIVLLIQTVLY